jgi:hypothetical protein
MATNFPASLDTLTNPTSSDSLNSPSHSAQHANVNDAVEALQAKVGADSSAVTTSHDYKIADHASRLTTLEAISHGKILQVVRATDTTLRSTTSTSFVDITGASVTITPTSATSNIIVVFSGEAVSDTGGQPAMEIQITDSSNVALSGAEGIFFGNFNSGEYSYNHAIVIGYASPASTSAQTYKARFHAAGVSAKIRGDENTTQMYALEVGA